LGPECLELAKAQMQIMKIAMVEFHKRKWTMKTNDSGDIVSSNLRIEMNQKWV
jgi:hypothetical protein